jgi:hypothetical protein
LDWANYQGEAAAAVRCIFSLHSGSRQLAVSCKWDNRRWAPPRQAELQKNSLELAMKFNVVGLADVDVAMHARPALAHHPFALSDAEGQITEQRTIGFASDRRTP